ncbi:MAG: ferritin family protein [Deltaproteobacteria bacterium]|jgi:rubrerythrin|nr:ferritin family protein [Deltaproteobacteria bacterium]MBW2534404.1 ferritin family protein [Deltaproteobacteria bacterium]
MFSLQDVVSIAIQVERNGERTYRRAAAQASNRELASVLNRLADDEARHAQWFSDLARRYGSVPIDQRLADMGSALLRGIIGDESFSLGDVDLAAADSVQEVLEAATELEHDTVIFYEMIGSFVTDRATVAHLQRIIEEERNHGQLLLALGDRPRTST